MLKDKDIPITSPKVVAFFFFFFGSGAGDQSWGIIDAKLVFYF
jgi:hypothetical protein